jgi:hypothetical protein
MHAHHMRMRLEEGQIEEAPNPHVRSASKMKSMAPYHPMMGLYRHHSFKGGETQPKSLRSETSFRSFTNFNAQTHLISWLEMEVYRTVEC